MKLHYAGKAGEGFGWGICNKYLIQELGKLCELVPADASPDVVFMPIADHDFNPATPARGAINLAYTFFEFPLGPNVPARATEYDTVFTGSTWCKNRLAEKGVTNTEVLIQGVDHDIFTPEAVERKDGEFRIFSGGKFEFRKGQDLVLAAFKILSPKYPNMRLVTAWQNPWPQLYKSMEASPWIKFEAFTNDWPQLLGATLRANGIDESKVWMLAGMPNQLGMAQVMNRTDLGLFPNRCEGGTNLVMMEYLACGKPVVASHATGHLDVLELSFSTPINETVSNNAGWFDTTPEYVASAIINAMSKPVNLGEAFGSMASYSREMAFNWTRTAKQIIDHIEALKVLRAAPVAS